MSEWITYIPTFVYSENHCLKSGQVGFKHFFFFFFFLNRHLSITVEHEYLVEPNQQHDFCYGVLERFFFF